MERRLRPGLLGLRKLGEQRVGEALAAADRLGIAPANRFVLGYPDRSIERLVHEGAAGAGGARAGAYAGEG